MTQLYHLSQMGQVQPYNPGHQLSSRLHYHLRPSLYELERNPILTLGNSYTVTTTSYLCTTNNTHAVATHLETKRSRSLIREDATTVPTQYIPSKP